MAQTVESQFNAPGYMPSSDVAQTCLGCQFASYDNKCRLYNFTYEPWYICESYRSKPEHNYFESVITPHITEGKAFEGKEWEVTIIGPKDEADIVTVEGKQYLRSLNNRLYSLAGLESSVSQWDNAQVYDNHLTQQEFVDKQGMRSPMREWLGAIVKPFWDKASRSIKGYLRIADEAAARKFKNAYELDILKTIGLSIDTKPIQDGMATIEGVAMPILNGFEEIFSLDVVGRPAAGGSFDRITAAVSIQEKIEMTPEEVQALINSAIAGLNIAETVKTTLAEALKAGEDDGTPEATTGTTMPGKKMSSKMDDEDEDEDEKKRKKESEDALRETRLARCELLLERKLTAAKLNGHEKLVREAFAGKIFEEAELDTMIKNAKEAQADQDPTGRTTEGGMQRGTDMQVFSEADKQAMMFARKVLHAGGYGLEQVEQNQEHELIKPRLFEAYDGWIKAGKPKLDYDGRLSELVRVGFLGGQWSFDDVRYQEALTLATVIKNTVNIMVALDYRGQNLWYQQLVDVIESDNPIDDVTLARLFGAEALDVVAKGAPYTEMVLHDEEETASHVKQGNYVSVALEDILADKINYFATLPQRISDAWALTLSAKVAGVFTTNSAAGPVLSDSGALFNSTAVTTAGGHANLLTTALSWSAYDTVITAMLNQTSRPLGAGRKLTNMGPFYLLHPNNLRSTAAFIRTTENVPGTANFQRNPYGPDSGQQPNLINVPDWTDTNDWAVVARYNGKSPIKLIFPRGRRTPEIFIADSELAGSMFTDDTIRYKLRMLTYRFSATYDVAPVVDWRLLHKENVA